MSAIDSLAAVERDLLERISRQRLWETNAAIAQWERNSGTAEERAAFDYVRGVLDGYGLRTTLLQHPALISYPIEANLWVLDSAGNATVELPCLGAAYSASTDGLEAEVVDLGFGTPEEYARQDVTGKVVLLNGLATPTAVYQAERAGAVGQIFINDEHLHYMIVSTIWGTPTPNSVERIPSTPTISVVVADGHALRAQIAQGPVRVRISSQVFMDWVQTPLLLAELDGQHSDDFVLFSGHLDSWEVGAMDNGSANATMIEVARLLAQARDQLYRGLRLAFWSGHSHGRYSGSTWYADHHWEELYDRCVAHVNIDSTGARGATDYSAFPAHSELASFGEALVHTHTGQRTHAYRMSRAGDMSFNGIGLPALFMSLSQVPLTEQDTDYVSLALGKLLGSKMPWWWHSSEDTMDKVDLDVLLLDTRIYLSALWQLCTRPILPLDFTRPVAELQAALDELAAAAGEHLDFERLQARATDLAAAVSALAARAAQTQPSGASALNAQFKQLSRHLIPLTYTHAGPFDHDPAWSMPYLPGLAEAKRLAALDPESDEYHFVRTQLVREMNRAAFALRAALAVVE